MTILSKCGYAWLFAPLILVALTSSVWYIIATPTLVLIGYFFGQMLLFQFSRKHSAETPFVDCLASAGKKRSDAVQTYSTENLYQLPDLFGGTLTGVDCSFCIPIKVDNALTNLLDSVCQLVMQSAKQINGECIDFELEFKHLLRMLLLRIIRRVSENTQFRDQIARDVLSCTLKHFHFSYPWVLCEKHSDSESKSEQDTNLNQSKILCNLYKTNRLHPAMCSRASEVSYLKKAFAVICNADFPEDLRCSSLAHSLLTECFILYFMQLIDTISDPDRSNLMISKILSGSRNELSPVQSSAVPFLYRYCNSGTSRYFPLENLDSRLPGTFENVDAAIIMKDGLIFAMFMKFLHKEDAVHYIQVLGDMREIKLSRHFASKNSFVDLALKYFYNGGCEKVILSKDCYAELETVLRSFEILPWTRKEKLLLRIEQEVHGILNSCYVGRFKQTFDFARRYYFDDKGVLALKQGSDLILNGGSAISKQTLLDSDSLTIKPILEEETENSLESLSDEFVPRSPTKSDIDLSNLRIEIEHELCELEAQGDSHLHYVIHVRRVSPNVNNEEFHKTVYRKFEHFAVLHRKLRFHYAKDLRDTRMPSKPTVIMSSKANDAFRKLVPALEMFLRSLLAIPKLRHSGTMYDFLTKESPEDFEERTFFGKLVQKTNGFTDNITNLANKETGKSLEMSFLPRFLNCANGNPRVKATDFDVNRRKSSAALTKTAPNTTANASNASHINPVLQNNALLDIIHVKPSQIWDVSGKKEGISLEHQQNHASSSSSYCYQCLFYYNSCSDSSSELASSQFSSKPTPEKNTCVDSPLDCSLEFDSYFDYLLYFSIYIYNVSNLFQKLLSGPLKTLLAGAINTRCAQFVQEKIKMGLHEDMLAQLLDFLADSFKWKASVQKQAPRSSQDKARRRHKTLALMRKALSPGIVTLVVGQEKHEETTEILFRILQYSKLNKHLFYQIFDRVLQRLYDANLK